MNRLSLYIILIIFLFTSNGLARFGQSLPGYRGIPWGLQLNEAIVKIANVFPSAFGELQTFDPEEPSIFFLDSLMNKSASYRFYFTPLSFRLYKVIIRCPSCPMKSLQLALNKKYPDKGQDEYPIHFWHFDNGLISLIELSDVPTIEFTDHNYLGLARQEQKKMALDATMKSGKDEF